MTLPDPNGSRAVLIGIHAYQHLEPLPGIAKGLTHLARLLRAPDVGGLPDHHVTTLGPEADADQILRAVRDAGRQATDTFLVYFGGHGLRDRDGSLYLALTDAEEGEHPEIGTLPYADLRRVMNRATLGTRRRMVLLDCCYSGIATEMGGPAPVLDRPHLARMLDEDEWQRSGTGPGEAELPDTTPSGPDPYGTGDLDDLGKCVFVSASATERSYAPAGGVPHFTSAIVDVLDHGIAGAGPTLSVRRVWRAVESRQMRREESLRVLPHLSANDRAAALPWVRNRADAAPATHPAAPTGHTPKASPAPRAAPAEEALAPEPAGPVVRLSAPSFPRLRRHKPSAESKAFRKDMNRRTRELDRLLAGKPLLTPALLARRGFVLAAGPVLFSGIGFLVWMSLPDGDVSTRGGSASPSASASASASPSRAVTWLAASNSAWTALLGPGAANSAAVMKQQPCTTHSLSGTVRAARNSYDPDELPIIEVRLTSKSPCRADVSPDETALALNVESASAQQSGFIPNPCAPAAHQASWIAVSPDTPAVVTYRWNREPRHPCTSREKAKPGTYLVTVGGKALAAPARTSFVLSGDTEGL
ncbi:caspase family protein [Streptomyces sp. NPDC001941]|uniref:caspase family protein n=1 Tax=Streptomyces sp. NPDC001941 TaxID=3154659 RepID=UPI003316FA59